MVRYETHRTKDGMAIVGYSGTSGSLVIPDKIDGIPVTEISFLAFYNTGLNKITLNKNLKIIGYKAFVGNNLKEVVIPSNVDCIYGKSFDDNVKIMYENDSESKDISLADILRVHRSIEGLGFLSKENISFILDNFEGESNNDPSGGVELWIENLLYAAKDEKKTEV